MKTKAIILAIFAIFMMTSCKKKFIPKDISPILICQYKLSGSSKISAQNLVIKNQTDWNKLMTQMDNSNNKITDRFVETDIDFDSYEIIAIISERNPNLSYNVNINKITETEHHIKVYYDIPDPGPSGYLAMSRPFNIVKIPKSDKVVVFEME